MGNDPENPHPLDTDGTPADSPSSGNAIFDGGNPGAITKTYSESARQREANHQRTPHASAVSSLMGESRGGRLGENRSESLIMASTLVATW